MRFDDIDALRWHSPAWRLLRADNAPLVLSFLGRVFVEDNVRSISAADLASRLDDELYALNERLGEGTFPKAPKAYLAPSVVGPAACRSKRDQAAEQLQGPGRAVASMVGRRAGVSAAF